MTRLGSSPVRGGTILVGIVVAVMVIAAGIVLVAIAGRREQDSMIRRFESMRAFYAQEAAVQIAVREMLRQQDDDGDGVAGTIASGVLASGITIGASKLAAGLVSAGGVDTITAQGSNGLAVRSTSVTLTTTNYVPGVYAECFLTGANPTSVNDITWTGTPSRVSIVPNINMSVPNATAMWQGGPHTNYAIRFRGTVNIPSAGTWTFYTESADGSVLWVNGTQVVDNDGNHSSQVRSGNIVLAAGPASIDLKYYTRNASDTIVLSWSGPTVASQTVIPPSAFTCDPLRDVPPVAAGSMTVNGVTIDGYRSKSGPYGGSNITSQFVTKVSEGWAGALAATNAASLSCNAECGVGSASSTAISVDGTSSISGTRTASSVDIARIWMQPPLSAVASSGALNVTGTTTLSSDARYSSITANTLNARIVVSGHRVIRCDGAVAIGSNCTIEIDTNSSLRLYMTGGTITLEGTSQVNANTQDPTRMHVIFTGSNNNFTMLHSAVFHGCVLNPNGDMYQTLGLTPKPTFHGAINVRHLSTWQTGIIRADASFGSTSAGTTVISAWRQTN
jgi:hypothetical protein